jgi:Flp pilus assembly protein TadD
MAEHSEEAHSDSEALRYLEEASTVVATDPTPHERMAAIYRRLGRTGLAEEEERKAKALRSSPKS